MATYIGIYNYTYGAGKQPNRQIQFFRESGPETIQARVCVLNAGGVAGPLISTLFNHQISVEMESTTMKAQALVLGRPLKENQLLAFFKIETQDAIMQSISNRGIEVKNDIGGRELETVSSLTIYDPT